MKFYGNEILVQENLENGIYLETENGKYIVAEEELINASQTIE